MASVRILPTVSAPDVQNKLDAYITIETVFDPTIGPDSDIALARSLMIALNTDKLALPDDILPNDRDTNRRGWLGDYLSGQLWSAWPIGTRLWLLSRSAMTGAGSKQGAIIELASRYISETIRPYQDAGICSSFDVSVYQSGNSTLSAKVILYRGNKRDIALEFQSLWAPYGG